MATIKEDYCSREIYRLLIEKGFDGEVHTTFDEEGYTQPSITLQMAMKWLREVHNVFISVNIGNHKKDNGDTSMPDFVYYFFYITDTKAVYEEEKQCCNEFATFEQACEASIKYCLENLI